jgi:hypothetical protein
MSAGATSDAVVQVALTAPPVSMTAGQSLLELPLMAKVIVPSGVMGASAEAASCAVKVTEVPTVTEAEGEGVGMLNVAASALTVCVTEGEVSPTPVS